MTKRIASRHLHPLFTPVLLKNRGIFRDHLRATHTFGGGAAKDSKTHATQLLIRSPKALHVRKHWHSANETHTVIGGTAAFACDGKKAEFGPGGFNYMPARMVHEAWIGAGSVTFITVDGPWDVNWVEGAPTAADVTP
jgi:mannose-6-phosphate isomerase-like protein (cupin superfamily)